jgi:hypothetical protein
MRRALVALGFLLACGWSAPARAACNLSSVPEGSPCICNTGINRLVCDTSPNQSCNDVTGAAAGNPNNFLCCNGVETNPVGYGQSCGCNNDCCLGACSGGSGTCGDSSGTCEGVSGGPCASSSQCTGGTCVNSVCLGNGGTSCSSGPQCSSGVCTSGTCAASSVPALSVSRTAQHGWVALMAVLLGAAGTLSVRGRGARLGRSPRDGSRYVGKPSDAASTDPATAGYLTLSRQAIALTARSTAGPISTAGCTLKSK